jgi:nitrogen-specific signal transduction histidine kinase/GAF domain-containing protein
MIPRPVCVLYSHDPEVARRIKAFVRSMAELRHVSDADRVDAVLQQNSPALVIMDLRAKECRELIAQVQREWPQNLVIALGVGRSEPLRDAEQFGIYAAEDLEVDRRRFQSLVGRAFDHLKVLQENYNLRENSANYQLAELPRRTELAASRSSAPSLPLLRFPRVFRRFDNVDALVSSIVEAVADAAGVIRVGLFARMRPGERYRLRAGLRCLPETAELEFAERDALVRWFELNGHLISRPTLPHTSDQHERAIMRRALDAFGAEAIVPLYARGLIIGWLFFGRRLTGQTFNQEDLENLTLLAENVSTVLENSFLYQEATLQKTLAETLLKTIPPGVVAIDENAIVRWFNPMAEQILGISGSNALNKPVEVVGSKLAGILREALESKRSLPPEHWTDGNTHRPLSVETRRLVDHGVPLGAVAVVHDLTREETARDQQALSDRATFWSDLAASMSHEVRNPLVAIKTFAQLLPERFDDADFRNEFNSIVVREIDRLDKIVTQINNFAHPPEIVLKAIDVREPLRRSLEIARSRFGLNGGVEVETSLPKDLPHILGDETALAEAFAHLVANAAEASANQKNPRIILSARPVREAGQPSGVVVTIRDNGKGIDPEIKNKVFSPFCTTKPRGMGLGLPIVKRTVFDHHGRVDIDSSSHGTSVSVMLPATGQS